MNEFHIYSNGKFVNAIVGDKTFVSKYCEKHGFTFTDNGDLGDTEKHDPIEDLRNENELLKAQLQAAAERSDFIEDCLAEMAMIVYGG